ncbi:MAG: DUF1360 domain-containing protein [Planctomycetaceae bacterium]|jgi:hypothetical protein|nr:DUF1360 domain-containing protein [Planctomycetaceae bacterium]
MEHFLLFCLASAGMTSIVVKGSIFRPFRDWLADETERTAHRREKRGLPPAFSLFGFVNDLISCVQCTGFWCGIFCGLFLVSSDFAAWLLVPQSSVAFIVLVNRLLMLFCCGAAGSFSAMLGDVLFETLYFSKEYTARKLHEEEHQHTEEAD